jgi:hypothetical protein
MLTAKQLQEIEKHIAKCVGEVKEVLHEVIPFDVHVDVQVIPPHSQRDYYTLVTAGMSERAMRVPKGEDAPRYAELLLCLPPSWRLDRKALQQQKYSFPVDWLRLMARFPHEARTYLAPGHTIPNGDPPEPLAPGSGFCCLLIREPQRVPDGFRVLQAGKKTIHFCAVLPLYREEMGFKLKHGFAALDELFIQHGVTELLDMHRPSVVA